ncbi:MAG: primosomal protein N' [Gemmatimonadetes bacterium]|nr:primosomal protein N' [Gemmatimonadota bacterium]
MKRYVEVALPIPVDRTFTYTLEDGLEPRPGTRVLVPFRRSELVGWVVGPATDAELPEIVRPVLDVLEGEPTFPPELFRLCQWLAEYYVAPLGIALRAAVPSALMDRSTDTIVLVAAPAAALSARAARLVEWLAARKGPQRVAKLRKELGQGSPWPVIRRLTAAGVVRHEVVPPRPVTAKTRAVVRVGRELPTLQEREALFARAPQQRACYELLEAAGGGAELAHLTGEAGFSRATIAALGKKGLVIVAAEEVIRDPFRALPVADVGAQRPTTAQADAIRALIAALDEAQPRPFLLHGVTGSGKTLVYIELLRELVLRRGRAAIVLVPEIALTPQTVARFRAHFGDAVAVLHSALSEGERYDAWRQIRVGERRIAVGARSAVFAPLPDLGAIVVDEEHDASYKQSDAPRYHARDVAVVRASLAGAVCVLGSATPALESWTNARSGKYVALSLPERVAGGALPPVSLVDLRKVRRDIAERQKSAQDRSAVARAGVLSPPLVEAIQARLSRSEQVILLLNRRGYSTFVQCRECGSVRACARCAVSLTFHRAARKLLCHHCRFAEPAPERCNRCGSGDLSFRGLGTEQVERLVGETFPRARLARMDVDTTSGKWAHHEILGRVERGEVDILLGTQMIAKGLDFPNVTLVGVINADVGIHLPDFRASERTFQLLSQVAGRAGRGPRGGEVIVQTRVPEHYAIEATVRHDHGGFAERELEERRAPGYPPHVRLVNVVISGVAQEPTADAAEAAARWVRQRIEGDAPGSIGSIGTMTVTGPAPCPIERLHGRWRWHFLLRAAAPRALGALCHAFAREFRPRGAQVRIAIDRDPVALL